MKNESARTQTTATTAREQPSQPPSSRWSTAAKRFVTASAFFGAALTLVLGLLSHLNGMLLARLLLTVIDWPPLVQAVTVLVVLVIIGLIAGARQIHQHVIDTVNIGIVRTGVAGVEAVLERIATLIEQRKNGPSVPRSHRIPPLEGARYAIRKPNDDVQLIPLVNFFGRSEEIRWLTDRLMSHHTARDTTVIIGISGIGKTALAAYVIDIVRNQHHRFVDGRVLVQCAGQRDPVEVVRHALERVDQDRRLPPTRDLEVLRQVSEELLANKDILIVLDGVGPGIPLGEVVRALRTKDCSAHILTTTTVVPTVNVAPVESHLNLEPLNVVSNPDGTTTDLALELFAHYAGTSPAKWVGKQREEAIAIIDALERHTYSLELIGALLQVQPNIMPLLVRDIKRLKDGEVASEIDGVLLPVWVAHTTTIVALPDEASALLFAFGAFGTEEAGRKAVQRLGQDIGLLQTDSAIETLVRSRFLEPLTFSSTVPNGSDYYRLRMHTLLHAYIAMRINTPEWDEQLARAKSSIGAFYAQYVPQYDRDDPTRTAQRTLTPDAENIAHALDWAIEHHEHAVIAAIAHGMRRYWHDRWMNEKSLRYLPIAVESAKLLARQCQRTRDVVNESLHHERAADLAFTLGRVWRRVGNLAEAEPLFQRDLEFRRHHRPRDYAAQAQALHQLAQLERSRGQMRKALRYCRKGLRLVRRQTRPWLGRTKPIDSKLAQAKGLLLAQQGRIERSLGNLTKADRLFTDALALFEQTNDLLEQGVAWGYRGRIARVLGDLPTAEAYFTRSLELARQAFDFRGQGIIATQLGRIARTRGDLDVAERAFTEGLNKARQVLDRQAEAVNLNYLGRIASSRGRSLEAEDYFQRGLQVAQDIKDRLDEGVNLGYLGRIASERGFFPKAREHFAASLAILREVEDRRGQALILGHWALLDSKTGHPISARWRMWRSLRLIRAVGDKRSEGTMRRFLGQIYFERGKLSAARLQCTKALTFAQAVDDASGIEDAQRWLTKIEGAQ